MKILKKILKKNLTPAILTKLTYYRYFLSHTYQWATLQNIKRRRKLKYRHEDLYNKLQKNGYAIIDNYINNNECAKYAEEMKKVF